ncbi:DNA-binding HxlR family transcriptional regulator [Pararhizobium capsulatum DSM 1112]|uniref:DNA-binding HxlR family transcriptional regulator n=1 Tax=Pararhizobium capsulatum DSM 1112 TaxID=1121113 RepID=A0ABU0BMS7_9HYPH|nr:helix-turn-helix domain-containing protein [Pararhizobium capsulatum]MDQ0319561.1 DNA-binding HxlR family transcriptional regulator [Pararhizobium capsulatum DSM 1112]
MAGDGYNLYCPVSKACELLEPRWTLLLLCEMWSGSTHFNEIRRGVPGMSPTLMSKRLREMEANGLVARTANSSTGDISYTTTKVADELEPIVDALGRWAHRNVDAEVTLEKLDAKLLMWNIRRKIDIRALPQRRRSVIEFTYPELPQDEQSYWLISKPGMPIDLCALDPGHDVDLFVSADLKAMTSAWIGLSSLKAEISRGKISLTGDRAIAASIDSWLVRSSLAEC